VGAMAADEAGLPEYGEVVARVGWLSVGSNCRFIFVATSRGRSLRPDFSPLFSRCLTSGYSRIFLPAYWTGRLSLRAGFAAHSSRGVVDWFGTSLTNEADLVTGYVQKMGVRLESFASELYCWVVYLKRLKLLLVQR
jgi:hypothetical protein